MDAHLYSQPSQNWSQNAPVNPEGDPYIDTSIPLEDTLQGEYDNPVYTHEPAVTAIVEDVNVYITHTSFIDQPFWPSRLERDTPYHVVNYWSLCRFGLFGVWLCLLLSLWTLSHPGAAWTSQWAGDPQPLLFNGQAATTPSDTSASALPVHRWSDAGNEGGDMFSRPPPSLVRKRIACDTPYLPPWNNFPQWHPYDAHYVTTSVATEQPSRTLDASLLYRWPVARVFCPPCTFTDEYKPQEVPHRIGTSVTVDDDDIDVPVRDPQLVAGLPAAAVKDGPWLHLTESLQNDIKKRIPKRDGVRPSLLPVYYTPSSSVCAGAHYSRILAPNQPGWVDVYAGPRLDASLSTCDTGLCGTSTGVVSANSFLLLPTDSDGASFRRTGSALLLPWSAWTLHAVFVGGNVLVLGLRLPSLLLVLVHVWYAYFIAYYGAWLTSWSNHLLPTPTAAMLGSMWWVITLISILACLLPAFARTPDVRRLFFNVTKRTVDTYGVLTELSILLGAQGQWVWQWDVWTLSWMACFWGMYIYSSWTHWLLMTLQMVTCLLLTIVALGLSIYGILQRQPRKRPRTPRTDGDPSQQPTSTPTVHVVFEETQYTSRQDMKTESVPLWSVYGWATAKLSLASSISHFIVLVGGAVASVLLPVFSAILQMPASPLYMYRSLVYLAVGGLLILASKLGWSVLSRPMQAIALALCVVGVLHLPTHWLATESWYHTPESVLGMSSDSGSVYMNRIRSETAVPSDVYQRSIIHTSYMTTDTGVTFTKGRSWEVVVTPPTLDGRISLRIFALQTGLPLLPSTAQFLVLWNSETMYLGPSRTLEVCVPQLYLHQVGIPSHVNYRLNVWEMSQMDHLLSTNVEPARVQGEGDRPPLCGDSPWTRATFQRL